VSSEVIVTENLHRMLGLTPELRGGRPEKGIKSGHRSRPLERLVRLTTVGALCALPPLARL